MESKKNEFLTKQLNSLRKINELHKQLKNINYSLAKLYPVTIIKDGVFYVFDLNETGETYEFKLEYKAPIEVPEDVAAAFSLDFYENRMSAVVGERIFDSLEGYVFIFHEFVHCFQNEECEQEIRGTLEIAIKAKAENNYMWEILHSFPYENSIFIEKTKEVENYFKNRDFNSIKNYHKVMKNTLDKIDFEYMIWQEWKEGFARYIENLIRDSIGVERITKKLDQPFNRGVFYEIGSKYIELLIEKCNDLKGNIKDLYYNML